MIKIKNKKHTHLPLLQKKKKNQLPLLKKRESIIQTSSIKLKQT